MAGQRTPIRAVTNAGRMRGDSGAGLVSTMAAFTVFLVFLFGACHLLLGLFARSVAAAAAYDGARSVAVQGPLDGLGLEQAEAAAEDRMRQVLGRAGDTATFSWTNSDAYWIQVDLTMPAPRLGWPGLSGPPPSIERSARVRVEALR